MFGPDSFIIYSIFTVLEFILFFIVGYFAGRGGLITTFFLSSLLIYCLIVYGEALGSSFANAQTEKSEFVNVRVIIPTLIFAMYSLYLMYGVDKLINFIRYEQSLGLFFYIWMGSILLVVLVLFINYNTWKYNKNPSDRQLTKIIKLRRKINKKLEITFNLALESEKGVDNYITLSEKLAKKYSENEFFNLERPISDYSTKLLTKSLNDGDTIIAKKIFNSYVDIIIPNAGLDKKSTDFASNAIILSINTKDDRIYNKIMEKILIENFEIESLDNEILLFNLACYHAIKKDKEAMISMIKKSIKFGKNPKDFMKDKDFSAYYEDEEFLEAVSVTDN